MDFNKSSNIGKACSIPLTKVPIEAAYALYVNIFSNVVNLGEEPPPNNPCHLGKVFVAVWGYGISACVHNDIQDGD